MPIITYDLIVDSLHFSLRKLNNQAVNYYARVINSGTRKSNHQLLPFVSSRVLLLQKLLEGAGSCARLKMRYTINASHTEYGLVSRLMASLEVNWIKLIGLKTGSVIR